MTWRRKTAWLATGFFLLLSPALQAAAHAPEDKVVGTPFGKATAGLTRSPGFIPFHWDAAKGRILLEIDSWNKEFLYVNWLATGVGNNDLGLDRGQPGETRVVHFERHGPKVFLIQPNYSFRANSPNAEERRAATEAFAQSVLWGFTVMAEDGKGRVVADATDFFLRDAHNVIGTLKKANQGDYKLDASRCAIYSKRTKSFPRNTEVEATLTFTSDKPGPLLEQVAPSPAAVTVRQHHSFIQLPDNQFRPRSFDPRSGYLLVNFLDFAVPIGEPLQQRLILRHRLRKKDPAAARSEPIKPLVYYVDRGAPEPIRSALIEGAGWWNQAFEAAGYKDAFRVELLPEGADPMDVRYNVIQWVHRSTRGWAYGSAVADPRTGEIIKGHVTMDSQRARQVYRLAEGLLASYEEGTRGTPDIERLVLARIRQLSAHEVGHTLGLVHNFAASTKDRASVMDYPHPLVLLKEDGSFDVSQAYATGIGAWDKVAIAYGYQDFPPGTDEKAGLNRILTRAREDGLIFITDADARPLGSAHPLAHLWDNGANAIDELDRVLRVRGRALERFSVKNIRVGAPLSTLEDQLVLIYLFHRYQVEAAAKVLGGVDYAYSVRGDGSQLPIFVKAKEQHRALTALLRTIQPDTLVLPERVLQLLPPRSPGYDRTTESFGSRTGLTFDALAAPEAAANITVSLILEPARAARLVEQHAREQGFLGLAAVVDQLLRATWQASPETGYRAEIQRVVDEVVLYHLMALAANDKTSVQARAIAFAKIVELGDWLKSQRASDASQSAFHTFAMSRIKQFQKDPARPPFAKPAAIPPGQPIGTPAWGCQAEWEGR